MLNGNLFTSNTSKGSPVTNKDDYRVSDNKNKQSQRNILDNNIHKEAMAYTQKDDNPGKNSEHYSFGENESPELNPRYQVPKAKQDNNIFNETFGSQQFLQQNDKAPGYNPFDMDSERVFNERNNHTIKILKSENNTPSRITNSGNSNDRGKSGKKEMPDEAEWPVSGRGSQMEGRSKYGSRIESNARRSTNSREPVPKRSTVKDMSPLDFDNEPRRSADMYSPFKSNQTLSPFFADMCNVISN